MVIVFRRVTSASQPAALFLLSVRSSSVSVIYFQARRMDRDFVEEPPSFFVIHCRVSPKPDNDGIGEISVALARIKRNAGRRGVSDSNPESGSKLRIVGATLLLFIR